jgi:hypothetical protein
MEVVLRKKLKGQPHTCKFHLTMIKECSTEHHINYTLDVIKLQKTEKKIVKLIGT